MLLQLIKVGMLHKEARMYIFKMILSIFSTILMYKSITENNLKKAYDYLFGSAISFVLVLLVQPAT